MVGLHITTSAVGFALLARVGEAEGAAEGPCGERQGGDPLCIAKSSVW